ncbi:MAG: DUF302 domain-containing protein [Chloroflexota bacterium]
MSDELGFEVHLQQPYETALETVKAALKTEGFGVLTQIDVRATLKEKLGEEFRPYAILGACNPPLAHRALAARSVVGLMLPCNVTVEAEPDGGTCVMIANPAAMLQVGPLAHNPELAAVAAEAQARLERVAQGLRDSVTA